MKFFAVFVLVGFVAVSSGSTPHTPTSCPGTPLQWNNHIPLPNRQHSISGPAPYFQKLEENYVNNETETISEGDEAAPCLINDVLYSHGQQIERKNECDYCICVDGDMFCYWQCATKPTTVDVELTTNATQPPTENATLAYVPEGTTTTEMKNTTTDKPTTGDELNFTSTPMAEPKNQTCIVTGTEYAPGEKLPQEDGSCLQCVCGEDGRVTCAPQDCVSLQQDEYHNGLDSNSLDMFEVDTF